MSEPQPTYEQLAARVAALEQEQQSAAAVLRAIARAGADVQGVLDELVGTAARVCDAEYALLASRVGERELVGARHFRDEATRAEIGEAPWLLTPSLPPEGTVASRAY